MRRTTTYSTIVALLLGFCAPAFAQEYVMEQGIPLAQRTVPLVTTDMLGSVDQGAPWNQEVEIALQKLEQKMAQVRQEFLENNDYLIEADPQFAQEVETIFNNYEQATRRNLDEYGAETRDIFLDTSLTNQEKEESLWRTYEKFVKLDASIIDSFLYSYLEKVSTYRMNWHRASLIESVEKGKKESAEKNKEAFRLFPGLLEEIETLYDKLLTELLATHDAFNDEVTQILQDNTLTAEEKCNRINELTEIAYEKEEQLVTIYTEKQNDAAKAYSAQIQQTNLQNLKKEIKRSKKSFVKNFSPSVRNNRSFKRKVNKAYEKYYVRMKRIIFHPGSDSENKKNMQRYSKKLEKDLQKIMREYAGK